MTAHFPPRAQSSPRARRRSETQREGGGVDGKKASMRENSTAPADGERFDPTTGEVLRPGGRPAPVATCDEDAEAKNVREERAELRRAEVEAIRAIDPACETEDDPPVVWRRPTRMGGAPSGVLLDLPRVSGRALPGSRLLLAARSYDGAGPNGGEARDYVTAFVVFRAGSGYPRRSVGVALRRAELREVARALTRYADILDARDAALVPPEGAG